MPVLGLSQLSRRPEKRRNHRPVISDLRIRRKQQLAWADTIMLLCRDDYYNTSDTHTKNTAEVVIARAPLGNTAMVRLVGSTSDNGYHFSNAQPLGD